MKAIVPILGSLLLVFALGACQNKKAPEAATFVNQTPPPAKGMTTIYFDYDEATIRSDQTDAMLSNSQVLNDHKNMSVAIEGNCDERGTNEYNMALGDRRSQAAKQYLTNLGVDPARMSTISYGEEKPTCSQHDDSCWSQNRRAEFKKK